MISLIICSRLPELPDDLKKNIETTIGCEYELVVIDNSTNKYNIFQAYNEGVRLSKGDILCFMHEDIQFHTPQWGKIVISYFNDKSIGIVGVVGTCYMPQCPAAWWHTHYLAGQLIQGNYENDVYRKEDIFYKQYNENCNSLVNACIVDGLWFCMPKSIFNKIKFDDVLYHGFHCYDIDICMQVIKLHYQVKISYDILIEHFSSGKCDKVWYENLNIWYRKWKKMLPISLGVSNNKIYNENKYEIYIENIRYCRNYCLNYKKYFRAILYHYKLTFLLKWKKYLSKLFHDRY